MARLKPSRILIVMFLLLLLGGAGVVWVLNLPDMPAPTVGSATSVSACEGARDANANSPLAPEPELPDEWDAAGSATATDAQPDAVDPREAWDLLPTPPVIGGEYENPYSVNRENERQRLYSGDWLSEHQNREGYWSAADFTSNSGRAGAAATHGSQLEGFGDAATDAGASDGDLAVTSLALLTYLGAGFDHRNGEYKKTMRQAILWMRKHQHQGGFENSRGTRDHALATIALCESYGLSGDGVLRPMAESALSFLLTMRLPASGWSEHTWGEADIISTAYALIALKSARLVGLEVNDDLPGLNSFLDRMADGDATRYSDSLATPPDSEREGLTRPPVCTAAWLVAVLFSGRLDRKSVPVTKRADQLLANEHLPRWERGAIDFEYWHFATLAIFQVNGPQLDGGTRWQKWEKPLSEALIAHQRGCTELDKHKGWDSPEKLDEYGSWDAEDIWSRDGRIWTTTLAALCLETYYRYQRIEDDGN